MEQNALTISNHFFQAILEFIQYFLTVEKRKHYLCNLCNLIWIGQKIA